ncbi:hypothetical protein Ddye_022782 [Dipteronia dyeriana]|uniref:BHLH domain-containing protein n=1 Tax=Dipteronia dyeriana TaxID=168575 RepID=A0AAD9TRQ3_9ROSI|nr:hypothetical protein Ddye_022782 [Dipteronia dyeriana]
MARLSTRSSRAERNAKEKNRRIHMKNLLGRLASLLPHPQPSKLSAGEIVDEATSHIQQLQRNGEHLKRKKAVLKGEDQKISFDDHDNKTKLSITNPTTLDHSLLEVNLVSPASNTNFMLYEIISVLNEQGAEVISAAHNNIGDKTIYIIIAKAISCRIGVETSILEEKIKELTL